jgi:anti-sigma factor RsiW
MKQDINACAQQDALIDFLYGELSEVETQAFKRHLKECRTCGDELADFSNVRQSVTTWRNESLGLSTASSRVPFVMSRQRSAVAAIREFFRLSPFWLRGAVGFATILFCVLAVIAVLRLQNDTPATVASVPAGPSEEQLNARVEQRVREELEKRKQTTLTSDSRDTLAKNQNVEQTRPINKRSGIAVNTLNHSARRPLSRIEREQLAMDLGLVTSNDTDLDLLQDKINQP